MWETFVSELLCPPIPGPYPVPFLPTGPLCSCPHSQAGTFTHPGSALHPLTGEAQQGSPSVLSRRRSGGAERKLPEGLPPVRGN